MKEKTGTGMELFETEYPAEPALSLAPLSLDPFSSAPLVMEQLERLAYERGNSAEGDRAYKILREFHRLLGFLRFRKEDGVYTARCAPNHHILPLLAGHFLERFGRTPWKIIDERRGVILVCEGGKMPVMEDAAKARDGEDSAVPPGETAARAEARDGWETLWQQYHRSVNNEDRANPQLQAQFMPRRYWKYLPEMSG